MLLAPRWPPATGLASYLSGCFFLVVGRRPSRVRLPNPEPGFFNLAEPAGPTTRPRLSADQPFSLSPRIRGNLGAKGFFTPSYPG
jgi:hypothetical protein